jgi:hypothetical protein
MRKIGAAVLAIIGIILFVLAAIVRGDDGLIAGSFGIFAVLACIIIAIDEFEYRR